MDTQGPKRVILPCYIWENIFFLSDLLVVLHKTGSTVPYLFPTTLYEGGEPNWKAHHA